MARSTTFDEWDDKEVAFSGEEMEAFDPGKAAEAHLEWLKDRAREVFRAQELVKGGRMADSKFLRHAARFMVSRMTWLSTRAGLELDMDSVHFLPSPTTKEGKAITARAVAMDSKWAAECQAQAEMDLRRYVTLCRRAGGGWSKAEWSVSNKTANAMLTNVSTFRNLDRLLNPKPPGSKD